jgi:hypothetical protein
MQKIKFFIPLFGILAIVLAACGAGEATTPVPTVDPLIAAQQTLSAFATQTAAAAGLPTQAQPTATQLLPTNTPVDTLQPTYTPLPTYTPYPTFTPIPTNTSIPASPTPESHCNWGAMMLDVTVPDGTPMAPSTNFTKTWQIKNIGTCTWIQYQLVFYNGDQMGAEGTAKVRMPGRPIVYPGEVATVSVELKSPANRGRYTGYWVLSTDRGELFGFGPHANNAVYVSINVIPAAAVGYDLAANACLAAWTSRAGVLPCPGTVGDANGYIIPQPAPVLESGSTGSWTGLLVHPQDRKNGEIAGVFPAYTVSRGDHFTAWVGCKYEAKCDVSFEVDYIVDGKTEVVLLGAFHEINEGMYYPINLDLTPLKGKTIHIVLKVTSYGSAAGDDAIWYAPMIVHN